MANTKHPFGGRATLIFEDTSTGNYAIASYANVTVDSAGNPTVSALPVLVRRFATKAALVDAIHATVKPEEQD